MTSSWQELTLGDICSKITDGAHNSPKSVSEGKPMVSVKDLTFFGVNLETARHISLDDFDKLVKQGCMPEVGDVLIAKDGNSALDTVCSLKIPIDAVLLSSVAILRPNKKIVEFDFLKFYFRSRNTIKYLKSNFISGAAIPRVVLRDFKKAKINIPPLDEQKKITKVLNSFENKILLNINLNKQLEKLTQTIFKSWFVDFDPVHAKKLALEKNLSVEQAERAAMAIISGVCSPSEYAENFEEMDKKLSQKLSKMPKDEQDELAHTASLFPSSFVESELGEVPKNFNVKKIEEVAEVVGGGTPSTKIESYYCAYETSIPWLSPKDLSGYKWKFISHGAIDITELGLKKSSAKLIPKGTVVISSRAPIGYIAIAERELCTNQGFKSLIPNDGIGTNFLYNWAKKNVSTMETVATGSTFKEISGTNMKNLKIIVSGNDLMNKFETIVDTNSQLQKSLRYETENLEKLRDTLLPKLLSGEIDLSEVTLD